MRHHEQVLAVGALVGIHQCRHIAIQHFTCGFPTREPRRQVPGLPAFERNIVLAVGLGGIHIIVVGAHENLVDAQNNLHRNIGFAHARHIQRHRPIAQQRQVEALLRPHGDRAHRQPNVRGHVPQAAARIKRLPATDFR